MGQKSLEYMTTYNFLARMEPYKNRSNTSQPIKELIRLIDCLVNDPDLIFQEDRDKVEKEIIEVSLKTPYRFTDLDYDKFTRFKE
ncbi:MAG: hypothetical protein ACE5J4_01480 [Candidatus Aenigmatarchaeota archaeon]